MAEVEMTLERIAELEALNADEVNLVGVGELQVRSDELDCLLTLARKALEQEAKPVTVGGETGLRDYSLWHADRYETSHEGDTVTWETTKPTNRAAWAVVESRLEQAAYERGKVERGQPSCVKCEKRLRWHNTGNNDPECAIRCLECDDVFCRACAPWHFKTEDVRDKLRNAQEELELLRSEATVANAPTLRDSAERERVRTATEHGRALLLEIGGDSEESWSQSDKPYEYAPQLADALARCVGYPVYDEETGKYGYPERLVRP